MSPRKILRPRRIALGAALLVVALAGGGYWKMRGSDAPGVLPASSAALGTVAGATGAPSPLAQGTAFAPGATPSDDPADWPVDGAVRWKPVVSAPLWVVPSPALPREARPFRSNNNLALAFHDGRLFLAWRSAPVHFASPLARIYVVSSADLGATWQFEHELALGADVREPTLVSIGGRLLLHCFEAGTSPVSFTPKHIWRSARTGPGAWTKPEAVLGAGEVPWDLKVRGGAAWLTSYRGNHYDLAGASRLEVLFRKSADGLAWEPVSAARPVVYTGGVSEVAFEFDARGGLTAVGRNEDGDATGFGSFVATASGDALADWRLPAASDPERYDSPRLFRHGEELFLLARRGLGGPFGEGLDSLPFTARRLGLLATYSWRPKRTALYSVDPATRKVAALADLPSCGDTAFPAVCRLDAHTFIVANYTSPLDSPDRSWIRGQVSDEGTQIYFVTVRFVPQP